jgi:predicted transcriptional regulator
MGRTPLQIMLDILKICSNNAQKTHIMYRANLSYNMCKKYIYALESYGYIRRIGKTYLITDEGSKFINYAEDILQKVNKVLDKTREDGDEDEDGDGDDNGDE